MNNIIVETYEDVQEVPLGTEEIESYNQLVVDLGLPDIAIKNEQVPIAPISQLELYVYETLCPNKTKLKDYKHIIPKRVLEAYVKCKDFLKAQGTGDKIYVWTDTNPDPILIAQPNWNESYLIGRWGLELQDFPTLLKRAKEKIIADRQEDVMMARRFVEAYDKDKNAFATAILNKKFRTIYTS